MEYCIERASELYSFSRYQQRLLACLYTSTTYFTFPSSFLTLLPTSLHCILRGLPLTMNSNDTAYETDSSLYLSDSNGRSLTPLIQPFSPTNNNANNTTSPSQPKNNNIPIQPHDLPKFDRYGITPHGRSKEEVEAGKELERLRKKKVEEGGVLGRESSRLVNAKRRRGFLDDEDFRDVMDDESD